MENKKLIDDLIFNINSGKIVAFPTETVYALSCDANNFSAIQFIYQIKKRDKNKLFSVFADFSLLNNLVIFNNTLKNIIFNELENGTTVIFNKRNLDVLPFINANNIGIRIPKHNFCRVIIKNNQ